MSKWDKLFQTKVNPKLVENLMNKTREEIERVTPISILVAGKTGSGKSTLINALFREKLADTGVGMPVTQQVNRITKEGVPLVLYDTKGLELSAESQHEVLLSLSQLLREQAGKGEREEIDLVYYCINSMPARIESYEVDLIEAMAEYVPVIIVLTQTIGEKNSEFEGYLRELNLPTVDSIPVLAKPYFIRGQQVVSSYGLQELLDLSLQVVPSDRHQAFINAQQVDLNRKINRARRWAQTYITTAFGVGFTPIPIADATLLIPMQITMLAQITATFGLSLDKAQIVSIIAGVGGTGGATYVGKLFVSSVLKFIPVVGSISGGLISGTTAGVLTFALAYSYIEVLKQITQAEITGRDLKLIEIQRLMNTNFSEQLNLLSKEIPENIKSSYIPTWLSGFFVSGK